MREQAVLALPRVAELVERRADLARLLAAVAPLLAKESDDDDLRLAALDAAQELLDILGRAALPQDATGEVDSFWCLLFFFVHISFGRNCLICGCPPLLCGRSLRETDCSPSTMCRSPNSNSSSNKSCHRKLPFSFRHSPVRS